MKRSIQPTYDSRETGPRYLVRSAVNGVPVEPEPRKVDDPFVRHTVRIDWLGVLASLLTRRHLTVEVMVQADPELMDDVLELDNNQLVPGRTRREEWNAGMHERLKGFAVDEELREMTEGGVQ